MECTSPRPVLVLGPLTDAVKEMLVKESPGKYCRCIVGELGRRRGNAFFAIIQLHDEISEPGGSVEARRRCST